MQLFLYGVTSCSVVSVLKNLHLKKIGHLIFIETSKSTELRVSRLHRKTVRYLSLTGWKEVYSHYSTAFTQRAAISASPAPGQYNDALFVSLATLM